jgi:hypothetical protein
MSAAPTTVAKMLETAPPKDNKSDGDDEYLVVRFDAASMEGEPECRALSPFTVLRLHAKSEEDAYYQMVMTDTCYSLYSQVFTWSKGWHKPLLGPIFDPLSTALKVELTSAIQHIERCEYGWATAREIQAKLPRSWITPPIAKQMWIIANDARDGGIQDDAPYKHREAAQLFTLKSISFSTFHSISLCPPPK